MALMNQAASLPDLMKGHTQLVRRAHYHRAAPTVNNLLTMLMINPEPIVFMAFPAEEGWPFPKYYGACGRLAAFENAGRSLADYYSAPWEVRVPLAKQLLEMALKLTRNDDGVALYLTDWTADNFAVDGDGRVTLVDGENFVLVDQKVSGISKHRQTKLKTSSEYVYNQSGFDSQLMQA